MSDPTPSIPTPSGDGGMDWNQILDEQEKDPGFKPVPADKYRVRIDKAEAVKAGTGRDMLKLQCKIVGGPYDTKMVFTNIVFAPDNPNAVRFTLRKLKALGLSEELLRSQNPKPAQIATMIQGVEVEAEVTLRPATDEYEEQNDVKTFRSLTAAAGVPAPPPVAGASVPPPPAVPEPAAEPSIPKPTIPEPATEAAAEPAAAEGAAGDEPKEPF